jgi:uroporphyrinogen decarboxylase
MAYLIYDNPELVEAVFTRTAGIIHTYYQRLIGLPNLAGFFQGDDMGFKASTLVSPAFLRKYVLPEQKITGRAGPRQRVVLPAALVREPDPDHE